MNGNGHFGLWINDEYDLPAYKYTCNQYLDSFAKTLTTYGKSIDHFHQLGNDRITATAHNGGYIQVLDSSRGFQWLTYNDPKKSKLGGGIALIQFDNSKLFHSDLYTPEISKSNINFQRIFGIGYFQKKFETNDVELIHSICAPFSDDPVIISEIVLSNKSKKNTPKIIKLINFWDIYLHHILKSLIVTANNRKQFGKSKFLNLVGTIFKFSQKLIRTDTDGARRRFDKKFVYDVKLKSESQTIIIKPRYKKRIPVEFNEPSKHNFYPKSIFLSMIYGSATKAIYNHSQVIKKKKINVNWEQDNFLKEQIIVRNIKNPCVGIGTSLSLNSNGTEKVVCIFGYADESEIENLIDKYKKIILNSSILEWNAENWKKSLIDFQCDKDPWLSREIKWHSYYTRSACCFDDYFNLHKFPQGSIYLFGHGLDGAIRDYMFFLDPIIFISPQLAKEYLIYTLSLMEPSGKLPYSMYGFGKTFTRSVHAKPSDLYLFFIWGILEYVYLTRDFNFLKEKINLYPKSIEKASSVLEKIYTALNYLFSEKVGFGTHDLIKCNDGDWSDGISLMVKNRKKFVKNGESNFNSAFALYLIPKILPLLKQNNPNLEKLCVENFNILKDAFFKTWNGKWFYRGWDGQGYPIGDKNIYLEHHTWILISKILDNEKSNILINELYNVLDKPSPIGQYISYPPEKTPLNILPPGWDVNGGIWHAMNSLLTWGYSQYDCEKAYNSMIKNSLTQRAEAYPQIWYGIWSGPDAYIANYAENAGEAFYHLATPMRDFPIMNLNTHACYLLSVVKLVGIEAFYDSIVVDPKIKNQEFSFKSPFLSIISKKDMFCFQYNPTISHNLTIKIKKPNWWEPLSKITLNGTEITDNKEFTQIGADFIIIVIKEEIKKIEIVLK